MDPCRLRACEALTEALATAPNTTRRGMLPPLSAKQRALNIPAHLVYLYGLVRVTDDAAEDDSTIIPSYPATQNVEFAALQKLYQRALLAQPKEADEEDADVIPAPPSPPQRLFQLSPTLQPSPPEQRRIQQEVLDKMKELQVLAEQVGHELEQETLTNNSRVQTQPKKTVPKQPKNRQQNLGATTKLPEEASSDTTTKSTTETETLQQVLQQIQVPQYECDMESSEDWIEVGGKTKNNQQVPKVEATTDNWRPKKPTITKVPNEAAAAAAPPLTSTAAVTERDEPPAAQVDAENQTPSSASTRNAATDATIVRNNTARKKNSSNTKSKKKASISTTKENADNDPTLLADVKGTRVATTNPLVPSTDVSLTTTTAGGTEAVLIESTAEDNAPVLLTTASASHSTTAPAVPSSLELSKVVHDLERQLAQKDRHLEEQQKEHGQQLRKEREQAEERLQALQLRLYICETKLKTYEDALEDHVRAVASNTSSSSSSNGRTLTTTATTTSGGGGSSGSVMSSSPERPVAKSSATTVAIGLEASPGKRPWVSSSSVVL